MIIGLLYLVAAVLFIVGIKQLTRVKTARRGNMLSALAMFMAVLTTLLRMRIGDPAAGILPGTIGWEFIIAGIVIGGGIGLYLARSVKMTAMPQLVAVFNGFGGGASAAVALSYLWTATTSSLTQLDVATALVSMLIGSVTLTGSFIAFGKLQGFIKGRPILFPGRHLLNAVLFIALVGLIYGITTGHLVLTIASIAVIAVSAVLGVLLVTPIGGADMPVVISLLNSYSGIAAGATGFVLKNILLIISGALVGASGLILTNIMCKAMNRSLISVLFGGFGATAQSKSDDSGYKNIKECSPEESAMLFEAVTSLIIVPGYGMAVAQAQHAVKDLVTLLEKRGVKVTFAIHPVAGRMPGHMNVLLAEADIPYEQLKDLDQVNPEFKNTDVALIVGANDVVNPAASKEKSSPIYGMPILKAHEAKSVLMVKRSLSPGFAGIKNELFEYDNTLMLFGDANDVITSLVQEVKEL